MAEQAILLQGPAAGRVVADIELNGIGWPPSYLMVQLETGSQGAGPELEVYLPALWNGSNKPAQDDEGRWYYMWRDPQEHGPSRFAEMARRSAADRDPAASGLGDAM
ncbi:hypothetical protein ACFWZS_22560 [[Kitasatospora] papulosa]|uniref:hypothetical protein n=1 Tax=[Kitasatospora] papulosa TaxID=1464011 RepID=UPI003683184D